MKKPYSGQQMTQILFAVVNKDRPAMEIIEAVKQATEGTVRLGITNIYTQLDRLERHGLVKAYYGKERRPERGGRPRRYYKITATGLREMDRLDAIRDWGLSGA